jgi:preprotein translocase subunit SecG
MKDLEIKLFYLLTFVFLILTVVLAIKVEALKNDLDVKQHNEKPTERVLTLPDSIPPGSDSSLERLQ